MKHIIIIAAILATSAQAQEATPGTACGAAGTGDAMRYTKESPTKRVKVRESRGADDAKPGALSYRVNATGEWVPCNMPPKPKDCPPMPALQKWEIDGGKACATMPGKMLPGRNIGPAEVTVFSQGYFDAPWPGKRKGSLTYECRPEGWVLTKQSCR